MLRIIRLHKSLRNGKGYTYDRLCDYLTKRKQQVVLNGESSSWTAVTSKFSQGSVLGPLLFSLAVNDLRSVVKSPLVLCIC